MPAPTESDRRFTIALTAAASATTVAVGLTAATLLGWFRSPEPATPKPAEPALVYVPIAPTSPPAAPSVTDLPSERLAMDSPREHEHDGEDREDDDD